MQKISKKEIVEPLNPRDCFYGGRSNCTKLVYNFKDTEKGIYVDFCNLYPTVQYYKRYPIGHPIKIYNPEKYNNKWFGLIKCKVLAPRKLYHPVLPQRIKVDKRHVLKPKTKINTNINHLTELLLVVGQQMNY